MRIFDFCVALIGAFEGSMKGIVESSNQYYGHTKVNSKKNQPYKLICEVRFIDQCLAAAPMDAVAYYSDSNTPLQLIVLYRMCREGINWALTLQDSIKPIIVGPNHQILITSLPNVQGKWLSEVL